VERYARLKPLKRMLQIPVKEASRFRGKDLRPYIYLTTNVIEETKQEDEGRFDERLWTDLISNDPTRIQAAVKLIVEQQQKSQYERRLLALIKDQRTNDLPARIAAGNALGMLGDPRLGEPELYEMEMVLIPEGKFIMGTKGDEGGNNDEKPQRQVYLNAFEIAKYPLTNCQYKAFLDASKHPKPSGWTNRDYPLGKANHPVVRISWEDA
jgi:formylglycine-generating enzyme required for sulfatase activity